MLKKLSINTEACIRCKTCLDVCFSDVIYWDEATGLPYAKYPEDCQICCVCEDACPKNALTVLPDWTKKHYPRCISEREECKNDR